LIPSWGWTTDNKCVEMFGSFVSLNIQLKGNKRPILYVERRTSGKSVLHQSVPLIQRAHTHSSGGAYVIKGNDDVLKSFWQSTGMQ
jgi:hypothetical protein